MMAIVAREIATIGKEDMQMDRYAITSQQALVKGSQ
jgi:hypothetical protein